MTVDPKIQLQTSEAARSELRRIISEMSYKVIIEIAASTDVVTTRTTQFPTWGSTEDVTSNFVVGL